MRGKRKSLSKRVRFEVFKRDKFTCQYCGAKSPDVVLQADHIHPVAEGGGNDILNLITSCAGCNGGKGAKTISDDSAVSRQHEQLAKLEERRQQIEMMVQWRQEIATQGDALLEAAADAWSQTLKGWHLSEVGRAKVATFIKKHGFVVVMDAIDGVRERYPVASVEKPDADIADRAFKHLSSLVEYGGDPNGQQMAYVIGILRNRCRGRQTIFHADLRGWHERGVSVSFMTDTAKVVDSWDEFTDFMEDVAE